MTIDKLSMGTIDQAYLGFRLGVAEETANLPLFLDESFGIRDYCCSHLNFKGFDEFIKTLKKNKILNENCLVYATHITHDGNMVHDELEIFLNKLGYNASYDGLEFEL